MYCVTLQVHRRLEMNALCTLQSNQMLQEVTKCLVQIWHETRCHLAPYIASVVPSPAAPAFFRLMTSEQHAW